MQQDTEEDFGFNGMTGWHSEWEELYSRDTLSTLSRIDKGVSSKITTDILNNILVANTFF